MGLWSIYRRRGGGPAPPVPPPEAALKQSQGGIVVIGAYASTARPYLACPIAVPTGFTLTRIDLGLRRLGNPAGNVVAQVWVQSGDHPGALLVTSAPVLSSSIGTVASYVTFGTTPTPLATLGLYWYGMRVDASDVSNRVEAWKGAGDLTLRDSADGATWAFVVGDVPWGVRLWGY